MGPVRAYLGQRAELARETARLERLEDRREQLVRQVRAINRPQVVERRARELGLVREGERAFLVQGLDRVERSAAEERRRAVPADDDDGILGWIPGI